MEKFIPQNSKGIFFFRRCGFLKVFFLATTRILIPALPILAVGQKVPPRNRIILRLWRFAHKGFFRTGSNPSRESLL